jgi:hypothetical protein
MYSLGRSCQALSLTCCLRVSAQEERQGLSESSAGAMQALLVERDDQLARLKSAQADVDSTKKELALLTAKAQEHMSDVVSLCS